MDLVLYLLLPAGDTPKGGRYRIALDFRVYRFSLPFSYFSPSFFLFSFFLVLLRRPEARFPRTVLICYRLEGQARLQKLDIAPDGVSFSTRR